MNDNSTHLSIKLAEAEERWRFALEGSRSGVWDWDFENDVLFVSKRWEQLLGFDIGGSPGEGLEKWSSRLHPGDRDRVLTAVHKYLDGENSQYEQEYRLLKNDGSYSWFLDRGKVMSRGAEDEPLRFIGVITNIDKLKETEQALNKSKSALSQAQQLAGIGYWEWNVISNDVIWSDETYRIFGLQPEGFTPTYESYSLFIHPEDRGRVEAEINRSFAAGDGYDVEHRIIRQDGKERHLHGLGEAEFDSFGNPTRMFGVVQDITEFKLWQEVIAAGESKLRAMSEASHDALVMVDSSDRVIFWSPAAERMFGYSAEEVHDRQLHPLIALAEDARLSRKGFENFAKTGDGPVIGAVMEFIGRKKDGTTFPIERSVASFEMGNQWYAVGSMRDITERKKAEQSRIEHLRLLQQKQERLDKDMEAAAAIQRSLLPKNFQRHSNFEVDWHFEPSHSVGGDILDILNLDDDKLGLYILDVSGHGVPASLIAVSVSRALTPAAGIVRTDPNGKVNEPEVVLNRLNLEFPFERFEKFFTMVYAILNQKDGTIRYSVAGHPPPILVRSSGNVELLQEGGYFIGLVAEADYESGYKRMEPGDVLALYTDGLTEHMNLNETLYGDERLQSCLKRNRHLPVAGIIEAVMKDVKDFSDGASPRDDISLLCLKHV